jgi:hypothetical protein
MLFISLKVAKRTICKCMHTSVGDNQSDNLTTITTNNARRTDDTSPTTSGSKASGNHQTEFHETEQAINAHSLDLIQTN